jgi:hypothetical protein
LRDKAGDVVITQQQQGLPLPLAEAEQLVATLPEGKPATLEQIQRRFGQPSGLLHRDAQAIARLHALFLAAWACRRAARAAAAR